MDIKPLQALFGGKISRVDDGIAPLFFEVGVVQTIVVPQFLVVMLQKGITDKQIKCLAGVAKWSTDQGFIGHSICNMLHYLEEYGQQALTIPSGAEETEKVEEVEVILGYLNGKALYFEHEHEAGKEEQYHLHWKKEEKIWVKRSPWVVIELNQE